MNIPKRVIIETPRLQLSDFHTSDWSAFVALFASLHNADQHWFNVSPQRPITIMHFFDIILNNQKDVPRHTYRLAIRQKKLSGTDSHLIGYVSLCGIHNKNDEGKPDIGVLIDPRCQRNGFAREAILAINKFAAFLRLDKLVCDIKNNNNAAINNVTGMGYEQVTKRGAPVIIKTNTVHGVEDWYRFHITRDQILAGLPHLIEDLRRRYWDACVSESCKLVSNEEIQIVTVSCN